jgi:RNA polymerase sigma-70 factor, ECF subfamily
VGELAKQKQQGVNGAQVTPIPEDPEEFLALVQPWEGPLYRHCCRLLGNQDDARDLCQEGLLRAYNQRHRYNPQYKFSTWLFTLTTRLGLTEIRKRQVTPLWGAKPADEIANLSDSARNPRGRMQQKETQQLLLDALSRLPVKYRVPVSLFYEKELSLAEIAEILEITENLVKMRLYRGREKLMHMLDPYIRNQEVEL